MRTDRDQFFGHNDGAVEKREIANRAATVFVDGKRTAGVNRNVITENNGVRFFAEHLLENLCALAIKAFAELDVGRDRLRIPVALYMSILFDVAHVGNFPDAKSFA